MLHWPLFQQHSRPKVLNRKVSASGGGSNSMMSMFGGGSNSTNITIGSNGKITEVPEDAMILTLEQDGDKWRLQTGRTADYKMTYLYITDTDGGGGFGGMIPGMGGSGAKMKTGKYENIGDSCQVSFTFPANKNDSVQIQFNFPDRVKDGETVVAKNVIRFSKSMMSSSFGGYEAENDKATLPRLYRLVQDSQFNVTMDESGWSTIVTYKNVNKPDDLEAYVVTMVSNKDNEKVAYVRPVEALKGGVPYLLHSENSGTFTLTVTNDEIPTPKPNMLKVSEEEIADGVYVLADDAPEGYFCIWNNGLLGSGRVYLPAAVGDNKERILINIGEPEGVVTGISEANDNGQTTTARAYDVQGRPVSVTKGQLKKGLYIVNGKKIVVK